MDKVWAVDDDKIYHFVLKRFFQELGVDQYLRLFNNGEEAILAAQSAQEWDKPRLILVDINMPKMNGWDLIATIRAMPFMQNDVSFVIVSSSIDPADVQRTKEIGGIKAFLPKPITLQEIEQVLHDYGHKPR